MGNNGISHALVNTDAEGINMILKWNSYLQPHNIKFQPKVAHIEMTERTDIRRMIDTIMDDDSFLELQGNWAKSMVIGRARVGGKAIGILANNPIATKKSIPVEPGNMDSETQTLTQSGSLWYPDNTLKTSQAFKDIEKENLPIVMFANLRGFSGGTTDMFQEILKFVAGIVQALESITQPVYIYLPPYAQLRARAMVVLSKSISPNRIKIWARPTSSY